MEVKLTESIAEPEPYIVRKSLLKSAFAHGKHKVQVHDAVGRTLRVLLHLRSYILLEFNYFKNCLAPLFRKRTKNGLPWNGLEPSCSALENLHFKLFLFGRYEKGPTVEKSLKSS